MKNLSLKFGIWVGFVCSSLFFCQPTVAQRTCRTCEQTISGRNMPYSRALEIMQNEEYLDAADLNVIRRRQKRNALKLPAFAISKSGSFMADLIPATGLIIGLFAALAYAVRDQGRFIGVVPPDQPQPGTFGGGRSPLGSDDILKAARKLLPRSRAPVAVFPPFVQNRTFPAIGIIWEETPLKADKKKYNKLQIALRKFKRNLLRGKLVPFQIRSIEEEAKNDGYGNQRERLYGYRVMVTLVKEFCQIGKTCKRNGDKLRPYGQSKPHLIYASERQTGELIRSDAQPECRTSRSRTCSSNS